MYNNKPLKGKLKLYIGPMFSSKTSSILEAYTRHSIGHRKCLLIKHSFDTRYDLQNVVTHDGRRIMSSVVCDMLCTVDHMVNEYQVVCIDEVQFFLDAPIFCDKWANQGIIVEAAGLSGTYQRLEFPVISKLVPLAEEICKKAAVCCETGQDADFTYRTSADEGDVVIGGDDKYKPVDRQTFFEDINSPKFKSHERDAFREFAKMYCDKYKISDSQILIENCINHLKNIEWNKHNYLEILKYCINQHNNAINT